LATAHAAVTFAAGALAGLLVAALAVSEVQGHAVWHGTSAGRLTVSALLALAAGAALTAVRIVRLRRAGRSTEVAAERRFVRVGWAPAWQRARLDLVAIAVGAVILIVNAIS